MRGVTDYLRIYDEHAEAYDALVAAEDCDQHLLPALEAVAPLAGASVLEAGVGTGRVTRLVAGRARRIVGFDRSAAMLARARANLAGVAGRCDLELFVADAREPLAIDAGWADVAVAGWVFGHLRHWMPDGWREAVGFALDQMERALSPGGALIVIETLGTGSEEPRPPNDDLAEYYAWLEGERGFARSAIRTDYLFDDVDTAAKTTGFFFGDDFARRVRAEGWRRVPECTGIWSRRRDA